MTKQEFDTLKSFVTDRPWLASVRLKQYLAENPPQEPQNDPESDETSPCDKQRTLSQNDLLHAWCADCAKLCLEQGLDVDALLTMFPRISIPMDTQLFKRMFIHPVIKVKYGKTSTAQLKKDEIDPAVEPAIRAFGEKGIELPPFGSIDGLKGVRLHQSEDRTPDYPEYEKPLI